MAVSVSIVVRETVQVFGCTDIEKSQPVTRGRRLISRQRVGGTDRINNDLGHVLVQQPPHRPSETVHVVTFPRMRPWPLFHFAPTERRDEYRVFDEAGRVDQLRTTRAFDRWRVVPVEDQAKVIAAEL